jgi:hypothetical protein
VCVCVREREREREGERRAFDASPACTSVKGAAVTVTKKSGKTQRKT